MPPRPKGPRLYLRQYRDRASTWIIRDGARQVYLGLAADRRAEAETEFQNYVNGAHDGRPDNLTPESAYLLRRTRPGSIYFVSCDRPLFPIKIGFAGTVAERRQTLQTALPWPLVVLATMPGDHDAERALHARFASLRLRGDWFACGPDLLDFVRAIPKPSKAPRARIVQKPVAASVAPNFRLRRV